MKNVHLFALADVHSSSSLFISSLALPNLFYHYFAIIATLGLENYWLCYYNLKFTS
ncbi:hypothetical protein HMPREF0765_4087 [Sphingobacterium spiritivorum ATCC 33300]|uniref:Uncharacterized protein n=1 Tax=Sphingobacterium spiritivorum ATCC 33300 TaxID=525372 RepID=C2G3D1_SPHSI|nr:hypothetical protein HMPREF0765_4087 [Sphingobacterium spiritivorum ATCC 33300]